MRRALRVSVAALVLLGVARGRAQPQDGDAPRGPVARGAVRTLGGRAPDAAQLGFDLLLDRHLRFKVGGLPRLPAAPGEAPVPAAYVTVTTGAALVFERQVAALARGAFAPTAVGACAPAAGPPGHAVRCVPALRAAATRALADEAARLHERAPGTVPTALLFADQTLSFATFLEAAYSVALATAPAPPRLQLAVRRGGRLGVVPFFLLPPRPLHLQRGATPLILVVRLQGGHISVETSSHEALGRRTAVHGPAALERLAGELKAHDPDRTVAFVTADGRTALAEVVAALAALRPYYPNVVLGATGPSFTRAGRRGE